MLRTICTIAEAVRKTEQLKEEFQDTIELLSNQSETKGFFYVGNVRLNFDSALTVETPEKGAIQMIPKHEAGERTYSIVEEHLKGKETGYVQRAIDAMNGLIVYKDKAVIKPIIPDQRFDCPGMRMNKLPNGIEESKIFRKR